MQPIIYVVDGDQPARQDLIEAIEDASMPARGFASAEAFLNYRWRRIDACLVAEVDLPGISGVELLRRMRALRASIPAVLITSRYEVPLAVEAIKGGAADVMAKPLAAAMLLRRLARLLDEAIA
ncbi:MAG: response regulator [Gammaproteobacteria bacterium]